MRTLYRLLLWGLLPAVLLRLAWRGIRQPAYWQHVEERFGFYPHIHKHPIIWLHAVSVGETRAATILVAQLQQQYPQYQLLLTHATPTGRAMGASLFGDTVWQAYLPYDLNFSVRRFMQHYRPQLALLMETELWPNLLSACYAKHIPVLLINARLSARSAQRYHYFRSLFTPILAGLQVVAAQSEADAQRLSTLGAQHVQVIGNLKFDTPPPIALLALAQHWRTAWKGNRQICLAASTRAGEEQLILDAWRQTNKGDALLVIVPRHPQRFNNIAQLLTQQGLIFQRRSDQQAVAVETQVWLGDSMGELFAFYALADVAMIGGSFLPFGGQNLIEAATVGCPVILGMHRWNFSEASQAALDCGAAVEIQSITQLPGVLSKLLANTTQREKMRTSALAFSEAHQGATTRTLSIITQCFANQPPITDAQKQ